MDPPLECRRPFFKPPGGVPAPSSPPPSSCVVPPSPRGDGDDDNDDDLPQSMAFTVTFDAARRTMNNKFVKRHARNLSLPIAKIYDNRAGGEGAINGKVVKKPGNHSEGYFSSDPEEEHSDLKQDLEAKNGKSLVYGKMSDRKKMTDGGHNEDEEDECEEGSDVASETGTYTIERESPDVITARLSIDANFGVHHDTTKRQNSAKETSTWVSEWATQVVNHKSASPTFNVNEQSKSNLTRAQGSATSKIPSPLATRARFGLKSQQKFKSETAADKTIAPSPSSVQQIPPRAPTPNLNRLTRSKEDCSDSSLETESYLKTTDKVISALAARISMDSGGESDGEGRGGRGMGNPTILQHSDSSTSESSTGVNKSSVANSTPVPATRYNRAFSLRRGRLDEPSGAKKLLPPETSTTSRSSGMRRSENLSKSHQQLSTVAGSSPVAVAMAIMQQQPTSQQQQQPQRPKPTVPPPVPQQQSISRTDTGRFSMRSKQPLQSSQLSLSNNGLTVAQKKKSSGGRSNSTLSSKEVEFQNWKRRKNYDPMKAAAEGKRKEAAKKTPIPPNHAMTQSTTNATTTPKSPVNSVLRSASFHGTRQLAGVGGGPSSSEEDEEITLSAEDEDWPIPQAPKTSLENTPRGSRVSLYSNNSNSSPRTRHKLEGVDNLVVSAIYGMSNKLKGTASSLLKKLRYLYDEDSDKCKQLGIEIDSLEVADPSGGGGGSPHKSPSKELASTLRNLKRLDSSLKVLDEVLFDDEDYETVIKNCHNF